jgi:DNA-binding SARP family transcriptional activator
VARSIRLTLLGGFTLLEDAEEIVLPLSAQRLVALLALHERPMSRACVAGTLWPDCSADRSLADLRTALWRANHSRVAVVEIAGISLSLRRGVTVDVRELSAFGRATVGLATANAIRELAGISWPELSLDLLPDWYDDWLLDERERLRQLRLHALEGLTHELSLGGRHAAAIQAALAAVRLEPLRETAHAALIKAYLAEGNRSEALRQFRRCQEILADGLAVEPSESLRQLVVSPPWLSAAS